MQGQGCGLGRTGVCTPQQASPLGLMAGDEAYARNHPLCSICLMEQEVQGHLDRCSCHALAWPAHEDLRQGRRPACKAVDVTKEHIHVRNTCATSAGAGPSSLPKACTPFINTRNIHPPPPHINTSPTWKQGASPMSTSSMQYRILNRRLRQDQPGSMVQGCTGFGWLLDTSAAQQGSRAVSSGGWLEASGS